ncbi:MAG: PKD domain-containing protein, partial [Bacteroidia bacterium]|nr:PKD domain-containing protein [Bacteroidia bacterium]
MKHFIPQVLIASVVFTLSITANFAQPITAFTANKTTGCSPLVVSFLNQSQHAVSYEWHTGIGTSTLSNPTVLYTTPGSYEVMLISIDNQGIRDTLIQPQMITVYANPVADFTAPVVQACANTPLLFTDLSQAGSGSISSWSWDFGDGKTSNQAIPSHTFTDAGAFPISLQVTNSHGCSSSKLRQAYIQINAPELEFTAPVTIACGAPLSVAFTPQQVAGLTHEWLFGDGGSSVQSAPTHVYQTIGSYDVIHIAEDGTGCRDTLIKEAFVNIGANTLSAFANDSTLCSGDSVHFLAKAPATSQVTWSFGDGGSGNGIKIGYVYQQAGTYQVQVNISDPGGCSASRTIPMVVYQKPHAAFSVQDTTIGCQAPFTVDFINQSTGGNAYTWYFWGGSPISSSSLNASATYSIVDSFDVRLLVKGQGGCSHFEHKKDYIKIRPIEIGFQGDLILGCAPLTVTFEDTTKSHYPIVSWQWNFGDGSSGSGANPQHIYNTPGKYDVTLIVTNSRGCSDTLFKKNYIVTGIKPTANFVADTLSACALSEVNFTNLSTNATDYIWYFGDGDTAMATHASHGFAALGPMDVVLIANNNGCMDTLYRPQYINVLAPLPVIGMTGRYLCSIPETVQFLNLSVGADTWQWTLPDGSTSTDAQTQFAFVQNGQYPISLMVTNLSTGCQVEITDSVYVKPIVAEFLMAPQAGCRPYTATFTDLTLGANNWVWEFGTGATSAVQHPTYTYVLGGYFPVSLTVENEYGCKNTKVIDSIRVSQIIPQISTNSALEGCLPLAIQFNDASFTRAAEGITWLWDFGDGSISTLQHPSHTYTQAGNFTVKLTVSDDLGCSKTTTFKRSIITTDPIPNFVVQPAITCPGAPVTLVSTSTGVGLSYAWDLGDGTSSVLANPMHSYANTGFVDISLVITDVYGCSKSITKSNALLIEDLMAEFVADTTFAACPPLDVHFTARNNFPHNGIFFEWDFGNGASGNQPNVSHLYTQPGVYDVRLVVGTTGGCRDTMLVPQMIVIEGPSASFTYDPGAGCPGTEFTFEASSPDSVTYQWIYGDGAIGHLYQSSHVYTDPGTYLPVLIIEDQNGCTVFTYARQPLEIYTPPVATFSPLLSESCDSLAVAFSDQSSGNIISWNWSFGDGTSGTVGSPLHLYGFPGTFDVSLHVTDQHGCMDSTLVPNAVTIHASPEPLIQVSASSGCLPFSPELRGLPNGASSSISSWQWSSGTMSHSGDTWSPVFTDPGIHSILLEVVDAEGCIGQASVMIEALSSPVAAFTVSDQESCAPDTLSFTDLSTGSPVSWSWTMGNGNT